MGKRHFQRYYVRRRCAARRNFENIVGPSTNGSHSHRNVAPLPSGGDGETPRPTQYDENGLAEGFQEPPGYNFDDFGHSEIETHDRLAQSNGRDVEETLEPEELTQEGASHLRSDSTDAQNVSASSRQLLKGHVLAALLPLIGTNRMTVRHFDVLRNYSNFYAREGSMKGIPSYSYLRRHLFPLLRSRLFVPLTLTHAVVNSARAGAPLPNRLSPDDSDARTLPVFYIKLSAWAYRDVKLSGAINASLRSNLGNANDRRNDLEDFENADVVRRRELHVNGASLRYLHRVSPSQTSVTTFMGQGTCVKIGMLPPASEFLDGFRSGGFLLQSEGHNHIILASVGETELLVTNADPFRAADLRTVLTPVRHSDSDDLCLPKLHLVYRMIRKGREPAVFLTSNDPRSPLNGIQVRCVSVQDIIESNPTDSRSREPSAAHDNRTSVPPFGILQDGRKYVVYRVLLYADDFEQTAGKKGSAGGLYMTPLTLPLSERIGTRAVRVVSLSPPGVSTQEMITHLIPDIVESATEGIECVDNSGERVTAFIDLVAFICDYHEANHASYVRGTTALAPCNLCTFLKGSTSGISSSNYAYTTAIHSGHPSFRRDYERMKALLSYSCSEGHLQRYGLKRGTDFNEKPPPFHKLHQELEKARPRVPRTADGEPVVPAQFDPYLSVLVAPDHLLTNLSEDLINLNFRVLTPLKRAQVETLIIDVLRRNGMQLEGHIYNHDTLALHSMRMSSLYDLLVVTPWAFLVTSHADENGVVQQQRIRPPSAYVSLLFEYQHLVSKNLFFSRPSLDGLSSTPLGLNGNRDIYFRELQDLAAKYIRNVDSLCSKCSHAKRILDKPNMHRLLELYHHSIPAMGHVRHFQELMFEAAHQPLKRALKQSNHRNAQISAMFAAAGNEWKCRLSSALSGANRSTQISDSQCRIIKYLLCGDHSSHESGDVNLSHIRECLWEPVLEHLNSFSAGSEAFSERRFTWVPVQSVQTEHSYNSASLSPMLDSCTMLLNSIYSSQLPFGAKLLTVKTAEKVVFSDTLKAVLQKVFSNPSVRRIKAGDIVQSVVHKSWSSNNASTASQTAHRDPAVLLGDITNPLYGLQNSQDYQKTYWQVLKLVQFLPKNAELNTNAKLYAYVLPVLEKESSCIKFSDRVIKMYKAEKEKGVFVLPLNEPVVKVLWLHSCWTGEKSCSISSTSKSVHHSDEDRDNQLFLIYDRSSGFPPRHA